MGRAELGLLGRSSPLSSPEHASAKWLVPGARHDHVATPQPGIATDGTEIFYKDWGTGQPVVFSHGWPLTADVWDDQLFLVASNGYRAIAHDRRGGGRSGQPWNGNDLDTYADDLAALIETLDLHDAVLVGHSTGGADPAACPLSDIRCEGDCA